MKIDSVRVQAVMERTPPSLGDHFTTYKQYKDDTDSIAGWLAKNALRCGYKIPTAAGPASQPPTTRLKGKARKEAREAVKAPAKASATGPKYTIAVSDFVRMAKTIADFTPKVAIPKALDNLFSRAIEARKRCAQLYEEHLHGGEESNKRHAHFTNVLNNAWETLRPFKEARTSRVKKPTAQTSVAEKPLMELVNRFSGLNVEQASDQDSGSEQTSAAESDEDDYKLTDVAPVVVVRDEEDIEDDFFFAIFSFMEELSDVRDFIRRVWESYRDGVGELVLSSLLTNTAIQLVRRAEHELEFTVERPKKFPAASYPVWTFPGIFMYEMHSGDTSKKLADLDTFLKPSEMIPQFTCSHSELCLWEPYATLKHFLYEVRYRGNQYIIPDVVNDADVPETFRRLKSLFPCFQGISNAMAESFANDEITSGIGVALQTETAPIWVAFGLQLLLDMQDELHDMPDKALKEVKQHARSKIGDIRRRKLDREPFSAAGQGTVWLNSTLDCYELDILGDNFRKTLMGGGIVDSRTMRPASFSPDEIKNVPGLPQFFREPDFFLRHNFVKCGMLKYGIYLHTHHYAVSFEFAWRGITSMVHLYVACRSLFPDDPVWPDMVSVQPALAPQILQTACYVQFMFPLLPLFLFTPTSLISHISFYS